MNIYSRDCLGMVLDEISPSRLLRRACLACLGGLFPPSEAVGSFTKVGREFKPSGLREYSRGMKPLNLGELG